MTKSLRKLRPAAFVSAVAAVLLVGALLPTIAGAQPAEPPEEMPDEPIFDEPCEGGFAGPFPCHRIDLKAFLPPDEFGGGPSSGFGGPGNDVWGWTDPLTDKKWVLAGRSNGTSFIDISEPTSPVLVADLPRHQTNTLWSDIKVDNNHAFVVAEGEGNGLQVFDLTRLRDIDYDDAPVTVDADAHYDNFGDAHNLIINEDTGFAYVVGINNAPAHGDDCDGSLHMVDIRDPLNPVFAGCGDRDESTHDAQCVIYHGPDVRFQGSEICFLSKPPGDTLMVVDVTDKSNPVMLSNTFQGEPAATSHQGWLTPDHRYFVHDDESEEIRVGGRTRTRVFDVSNLTDVFVHSVYHGELHTSDHNLYIKGQFAYEANYFDGLRLINISRIDQTGPPHPDTPTLPNNTGMREVGCFDTDPTRNDIPGFGGSWSNYPFFDDRIVVIHGFDGLFVLEVQPPEAEGHRCLPWGTTPEDD